MKYYRNDNKTILPYYEILNNLIDYVKPVGTEECSLESAINRVVASDIKAETDIPLFDKSPFDGYCFRSVDTKNASKENLLTLKVIDNIKASEVSKKNVGEYEAVRLMTGAKIAKGCDCVSKYEEVIEDGTTIKISRPYKKDENIIYRGEEVKKGEVLVGKGSYVDMGNVGALASLNINKIKTYRRVKINLISTGSEIVDVGAKVEEGQIYNSSKWTIVELLKKENFDVKYIGIVKDDLEKLNQAIEKSMNEADVTITTGGVSVGDYDLINSVAKSQKFKIYGNGTNLKPGMASIYGIKNKKLFIGLSGNPMAAFANFLVIGMPVIRKMQGVLNYQNVLVSAKSIKDIKMKKINSYRVMTGKLLYENCEVKCDIIEKQGNSILTSLTDTNFYPILEPNTEFIKKNQIVKGVLL